MSPGSDTSFALYLIVLSSGRLNRKRILDTLNFLNLSNGVAVEHGRCSVLTVFSAVSSYLTEDTV